MCGNFIGFGSCSKSYIYILFSIIIKIINDNFFFNSFSTQDMKKTQKTQKIKPKKIINQKILLYQNLI